jgi:signal transduction histidine kinase
MDKDGRPVDHKIININSSFEQMIGRKGTNILGERLTNIFLDGKIVLFGWLRTFSTEALKDPSIDFDQQVSAGDSWYQVSAYSPKKGYVAVLIADITESKRHEDQLKYYSDEVAATNRELKSFVNTIAHDFRSPMVNLKGFSTELGYTLAELKQVVHESESFLPQEFQAKVKELLEKDVPDSQQFINLAVDRLNRMVDALLNLARIGRRDITYKNVDMSDLVKAVLQSYQHQIAEKDILVEVGTLPKIETDPLAMEQIIGNLVDNAIKYLYPGRRGKIEISCVEDDYNYVVSVKENGRGIAASDCEEIFEPFRRSGKNDQPGDGVGLSHVRTLIRKLGGKVWCESEIGVGTTMSLIIPKKRSV